MHSVIDFHSHILPGMDDGSDSVATSLQLLKAQREQGAEIVCATSHFYRRHETIERFLERREAAYETLCGSMEPGLPQIRLGAEVAFYAGISEDPDLEALCLSGTKTLLLEMPFTHWSNPTCDEVLRISLDRKLRVVLAHPERYQSDKNNRDWIARFADMGIALQVNCDTVKSFVSRRTGLALLKQARVPLLGSDCHNLTARPPHIHQARRVIARALSEEFLAEMDENAALLTAYVQDAHEGDSANAEKA